MKYQLSISLSSNYITANTIYTNIVMIDNTVFCHDLAICCNAYIYMCNIIDNMHAEFVYSIYSYILYICSVHA